MVIKTTFIAAAVLGLALGAAGCNRQESSKEVREDVAEAQQDANEDVAEQQADRVAEADGSTEDRAQADYDVALAKADGERKVAEEACEALGGDAQANCKKEAELSYEAAKAQAQSQLDMVRNNSTVTGGSTGTNDMPPPPNPGG